MKRLLGCRPCWRLRLGAVTSFWFTLDQRAARQPRRTDSPALGAVHRWPLGLPAVADGYRAPPPPLTKLPWTAWRKRWRCCATNSSGYAAVPGRAEDAARLSAAFETYQQAASKVADIPIKGKGDVGEAPGHASRAKAA